MNRRTACQVALSGPLACTPFPPPCPRPCSPSPDDEQVPSRRILAAASESDRVEDSRLSRRYAVLVLTTCQAHALTRDRMLDQTRRSASPSWTSVALEARPRRRRSDRQRTRLFRRSRRSGSFICRGMGYRTGRYGMSSRRYVDWSLIDRHEVKVEQSADFFRMPAETKVRPLLPYRRPYAPY